mgnify:CR=1 FL=1
MESDSDQLPDAGSELIFITNSNQEIIFTVYPGGSGTIET